MKRIYALGLTLLCGVANAGLIAHTDYTAGSVITSAGQNTNENTIVNEINGSLNSANIATNGIQTANITDLNVTLGKLATVVQSSITIAVNLASYRRPALTWVSGTTASLETGINGTSGQAAVVFPDGTLRTDSTALHIVLDVSRVANYTSGTIQSGVRTGTVANNTWYNVFAVKSQANSTDFVLVADSQPFTGSAYSTLNTNFGTNSWVYLGLIANGDNLTNPSGIANFIQSNNMVMFYNPTSGYGTGTGVRLSSATASSALTYTYTSGMTAGLIPVQIGNVLFSVGKTFDAAGKGLRFTNSGGTIQYGTFLDSAENVAGMSRFWGIASQGLQNSGLNTGSGIGQTIYLSGYTDSALGVGSNPLF